MTFIHYISTTDKTRHDHLIKMGSNIFLLTKAMIKNSLIYLPQPELKYWKSMGPINKSHGRIKWAIDNSFVKISFCFILQPPIYMRLKKLKISLKLKIILLWEKFRLKSRTWKTNIYSTIKRKWALDKLTCVE